jgi:hypothetical protein
MRLMCCLAALASIGAAATADPWKDESGHGRWRDDARVYAYNKDYKEEYWEGDCKVERKWSRDGEYKEERKCMRGGYDK